ncbi:MAG TPA: winged helix-turn-helix domain-containing protein [Bryobacteraceae bacterium]|nr:winged helix-turn-helix domain-containing protein [Bryobacteraceae bacterium]
MWEAVHGPAIYRFGAFELNLKLGELRKRGVRLRLTGQPLQVLAVLVERAGEIVTREELHSKLWPANTFVDFDHGLNNAIARIREVLNDSSEKPCYIETFPRRGYRFIAQLHPTQTPAVPTDVAEPDNSPAPQADHEICVVAVPQSKPAIMPRRLPFGFVLPAAAGIALFIGTFLVYRVHRDAGRTSGPPFTSVAVLPLKNLSGDAHQEYLADGITEEVIGKLATLHGIRVTSRTSSMHFRDTNLSAPEIARALGVDALVEGSVIREGNHIRVHAQLIRAASDEHFWSETYDREMEDVLRLESEVAESIVEKVEIAVAGTEQARLSRARQISPEVYAAYLKGKLGLHNSSTDLQATRVYFEEAIRGDPTFAPAYVGLARIYYDMGSILGGAPPDQTRPKAIAAARRAIELDPDNAEAHALMAEQYLLQWRWADAEKEFKRAIDLKPNDAAANMGYAKWLVARGRIDEAISWARRGKVLDPIGVSGLEGGWVLFCARRYDEAIHEMRALLAVRPDLGKPRLYLGFALIGKGRPALAAVELEKVASMTNRSPGALEVLAMAYGFAGRGTDALRVLDELKRRSEKEYIPAGAFVNPYLGLHDYDGAIAGYERACKEQSPILVWMKVSPFTDPLRGDPRFQNLIRRVGLQ